MGGSAVPAGQLTKPGLEGAHPGLPPDPYDPARAQALLREAGWADGFRIVLHADGGSFLNEAAAAQAIAQFWTRIGLAVEVSAVPAQIYLAQANRQEYSAFLTAQGGITAAVPLRSLVATVDAARGLGSTNRSRYTNTAFDAVLTRAFVEMDGTQRQRLYEQAAEIAAEDVAMIPVFHASNTAAARPGFAVQLWPDRRFNALMVRPEPR
jgi:peptide/nickel transport system substrate-binding protein